MRMRFRNVITPRPWVARLALGGILVIVLGIVSISRLLRGRRRPHCPAKRRSGTLLAVAGFDNPNWLRAHFSPFATLRSVRRVVLVCHEALARVEGVTFECPPGWLAHLMGRSMAKIVWAVRAALKYRPDVLVGYHIMPNALVCLAVGAVLGRKVIYQMTGGPVQLLGGGYGSEAAILRRLARPSPLLERLMLRIVRHFDAVVVRGGGAQRFLRMNHVTCPIAVITAGIDAERLSPNGFERRYDIVTVARLVPVKRLDRFLEVVAALVRQRPTTRAAVVGDGPLRKRLEGCARRLGLNGHVVFLGAVDDVPSVLRRSRLFVLTSENEGVSIAMLEAMATGLPAVVPRVGELPEFVAEGRTGLFIDPARPEEVGHRILDLLERPARIDQMSRAARESVAQRSSVAAVAARWDGLLKTLVHSEPAAEGD